MVHRSWRKHICHEVLLPRYSLFSIPKAPLSQPSHWASSSWHVHGKGGYEVKRVSSSFYCMRFACHECLRSSKANAAILHVGVLKGHVAKTQWRDSIIQTKRAIKKENHALLFKHCLSEIFGDWPAWAIGPLNGPFKSAWNVYLIILHSTHLNNISQIGSISPN